MRTIASASRDSVSGIFHPQHFSRVGTSSANASASAERSDTCGGPRPATPPPEPPRGVHGISMARPSTISAAPTVTIHPVAAPGPVNARDPELAWMMGSDVLGLEDPELGFVAAATVVDTSGVVVVFEP